MLPRIEIEEALAERTVGTIASHDGERVALPHGHPMWARDGASISQRARDALARLQPLAIRVLRFWDHRLHSIVVDGRRVHVDPSGSYWAQ